MSYLHNSLCYAELPALYSAIAAGCSPATSDGKAMTCTPTDTGYTLATFDGVTTTTIEVTPPLIDCVPQYSDAISLGWQCVAVIAIAWGLSILRRAL